MANLLLKLAIVSLTIFVNATLSYRADLSFLPRSSYFSTSV
jgi:hypothetical protein